MNNITIKLRKDTFKKTIALRVIFYTMLLFCSTLVLYVLDLIISYYIKYLIFIMILLVLALFFQYLIYAISFGKKISYNDFKSVLLENELSDIRTGELNHPIQFLFPEFDLFYKLENSVLDKEDSKKLNEIAATSIDEEKALQIENEFKEFISNNLKEILGYDLVIKMKRKGKAIFDNLVEQFPELEKLVPFTDPAVVFSVEKIKGRNILIFDDSIHYSLSAQKIIDLLKTIGYNKILFLTVIAQDSSLNSLRKKYPESENVRFLQFKTADGDSYKEFYSQYMFGYLDHVNRSLENDHFLIKLKVDTLIKKEEFMELFGDKDNFTYEVERFVENKNEYKISVECPWIYEKMKKPYFNNIKMDMVKVRFFVKMNQPNEIYPFGITDINLSPALIPREFTLDLCDKKKEKEICILYKQNEEMRKSIPEELKDLLCINCLIRTLTNDFLNEFMEYFKKKLIEKNKANIIEEKIYPPFPQEIYRL